MLYDPTKHVKKIPKCQLFIAPKQSKNAWLGKAKDLEELLGMVTVGEIFENL